MRRDKKIIILESSFLTGNPWGGSAREAIYIHDILAKNHFQVEITKGYSKIGFFNRSFWIVKHLMQNIEADLIVSIGSPFFAWIASLLAKKKNIPLIHYLDYLTFPEKTFEENFTLIEKLHFNSLYKMIKTIKIKFENYIERIQSNRLFFKQFISYKKAHLVYSACFIKNLICKSYESELAETSEIIYPIFEDDFYPRVKKETTQNFEFILYYGALDYKRGVIDVIEAIQNLKTKLPSIKLIIAGHPIDKESLRLVQEIITGYKLEKEVMVITSYLEKIQLFNYVFQAKAIVLPFHFPLTVQPPLTLIESMKFGKVVIARNIGSIGEIVIDNYSGFFCSNAEEIAEKIQECFYNKNLKEQIEKNAKKTIEELRVDKGLQKFLDVVKEVI